MDLEDLPAVLLDEDYREALAEQAYLRERTEEAARDREHTLEPADYFTVAWESLSDDARKPYRTAITVAFEGILDLQRAKS